MAARRLLKFVGYILMFLLVAGATWIVGGGDERSSDFLNDLFPLALIFLAITAGVPWIRKLPWRAKPGDTWLTQVGKAFGAFYIAALDREAKDFPTNPIDTEQFTMSVYLMERHWVVSDRLRPMHRLAFAPKPSTGVRFTGRKKQGAVGQAWRLGESQDLQPETVVSWKKSQWDAIIQSEDTWKAAKPNAKDVDDPTLGLSHSDAIKLSNSSETVFAVPILALKANKHNGYDNHFKGVLVLDVAENDYELFNTLTGLLLEQAENIGGFKLEE